jgi:hypothetical protein
MREMSLFFSLPGSVPIMQVSVCYVQRLIFVKSTRIFYLLDSFGDSASIFFGLREAVPFMRKGMNGSVVISSPSTSFPLPAFFLERPIHALISLKRRFHLCVPLPEKSRLVS